MAKQTKTKTKTKTKPVGAAKSGGTKKPVKKKAVAKTKAAVSRKTVARKATTVKKKLSPKAKPKKTVARKVRPAAKRPAVKKKTARTAPAKEVQSPESSTLSGRVFGTRGSSAGRRTGSVLAGQSGDLQGLSRREGADSESVEELVAEGQYREAEVVSGVEDALDPDEGEVRTHEVLQDDVPEEYLDND